MGVLIQLLSCKFKGERSESELDAIREFKIMELLSDDPSMILMFKNKCITDNMWKIAIENEPSLFQYMTNPSEEMILLALREDGANIKYLPKMGITITPKMAYTALKNYPGAIYLLPIDLQTRNVKEFACTEDPTLMKEMDLKKEFVERQLRKDPLLVRFLKNPTGDQWCRALEASPNICAFIETFTPRMKEIMLRKYPEMIQMIPRLRDSL